MSSDLTFLVYPQHITVGGTDSEVDDLLRNYLSYDAPNSRHIRKYKIQEAKDSGDEEKARYWQNWDGKTSLYKDCDFPVGFLWRVGTYLRIKGYKIEVIDNRTKPYKIPKTTRPEFLGVLRPYQNRALERMMDRQRGIVDIATGGGKTVIAMALMAQRPLHTWVMVPTIPLVDEWLYKSKEFLRFPDGDHHVGYASGKQYDLDIINIGNVQTIYNALFRRTAQKKTREKYNAIANSFINADMILVDEAHHASAITWRKVINTSNAYYRYGFTATTDLRTDQADLEYYGLLGEKIVNISASDLIQTGHISPARVKFHRWGQRYFVPPIKYHGPQGVEDIGIVFNHLRNNMIALHAWKAWVVDKRRTMVMVRRLDHGELLCDLIRAQRDRSPLKHNNPCRIAWVHGKSEERERIITDFREGKINILIAQNQLLSEGIDIPEVSCVIMGAGGKSAIKTIQSLGRGIRLAEGKSDLLIHDYADEGRYIDKHAKQRLETYASEGAFFIDANGTSLEADLNYLKRSDFDETNDL